MIFIKDIPKFLNKIKADKECIAYKPIGMTPMELVNIFIKECGFSKGGFSGRLDPMAHGASMLLFDEKCKNVAKCHELNKIYTFKIILGISTTSMDLLGYPNVYEYSHSDKIEQNIIDILTKFQNDYIQRLPHYCSYQVKNNDNLKKPIWWWAKNKRLDEITIPSFSKRLYKFNIEKIECMKLSNISKVAINRISELSDNQNFEQNDIINSWLNISLNDVDYHIITINVHVESGFYIRSLVDDIGKCLAIPTTTYEIERNGYFNY